MSNLSPYKPQRVEDVSYEEAEHTQIEHVPALVSGEQKQDVAQAMESQCEHNEALIIQTSEGCRQKKEVRRTKQRGNERLRQGKESGVLPFDGKDAEKDVERVENQDRILPEQHKERIYLGGPDNNHQKAASIDAKSESK